MNGRAIQLLGVFLAMSGLFFFCILSSAGSRPPSFYLFLYSIIAIIIGLPLTWVGNTIVHVERRGGVLLEISSTKSGGKSVFYIFLLIAILQLFFSGLFSDPSVFLFTLPILILLLYFAYSCSQYEELVQLTNKGVLTGRGCTKSLFRKENGKEKERSLKKGLLGGWSVNFVGWKNLKCYSLDEKSNIIWIYAKQMRMRAIEISVKEAGREKFEKTKEILSEHLEKEEL